MSPLYCWLNRSGPPPSPPKGIRTSFSNAQTISLTESHCDPRRVAERLSVGAARDGPGAAAPREQRCLLGAHQPRGIDTHTVSYLNTVKGTSQNCRDQRGTCAHGLTNAACGGSPVLSPACTGNADGKAFLTVSLPLETPVTVSIIGVEGEICWFSRTGCRRQPFALAPIQ